MEVQCGLPSADLVQLAVLRAPLAADFKRAADVGTKVVMAATVIDRIEPCARTIDRSVARPICSLGLGWRAKQTVIVRQ